MKSFYMAVDEVFALNGLKYGSYKNDNGEIKYNKLRDITSNRRISESRVLWLEKELNALCANYDVFISHCFRANSFGLTIAILDADYEKIQTEGFVAAEILDDPEYPTMKVEDAIKNGVKRITIKKACRACGDFRRFHLVNEDYSCVSCYDHKTGSAAMIKYSVSKHNQSAAQTERNYNNVHKPIIMYGMNTAPK